MVRLRGQGTLAKTSISARDAIHAAVMINNGLEWIASFDKGFDSVPAIRRLELKWNSAALIAPREGPRGQRPPARAHAPAPIRDRGTRRARR